VALNCRTIAGWTSATMVLSRENRNVDDSIDSTTNPHRGPLTLHGAFAGSSTVFDDFSSEFESGSEGVPGRSRDGAELSCCECFSDITETGSTVEAIELEGNHLVLTTIRTAREIIL